LVDVKSGSDHVVLSASCSTVYQVVKYDDRGVYLTTGCTPGCGPGDLRLWLWNFSSSTLVKLGDRHCFGWVIRNQIAWGTTFEGTSPSYLLRLDLTSGQERIWLTTTDALIGLDGEGLPLLTHYGVPNGSALSRVTAPQTTEQLITGPYFTAVISDGSRTWLGPGISLYTTASGVQRVSDFNGTPLGPLN
jgi:hypothetical protein